jgi:hypothetical protein
VVNLAKQDFMAI